jgi:hypothetical protein
MDMIIPTSEAECRLAVEWYCRELARAGFPVALSTAAGNETVVGAIWGSREMQVTDDECDKDLEMEQGPAEDEGLRRVVEHYLPTLELLGSDPAVAKSWLRR